MLRPALTKDIHIQSFKDYYWLKEELQAFCREHGLSASGSKTEISERIEFFFKLGNKKAYTSIELHEEGCIFSGAYTGNGHY